MLPVSIRVYVYRHARLDYHAYYVRNDKLNRDSTALFVCLLSKENEYYNEVTICIKDI